MKKLKITSLCLVILTLISCDNRRKNVTVNKALSAEGATVQIDTAVSEDTKRKAELEYIATTNSSQLKLLVSPLYFCFHFGSKV